MSDPKTELERVKNLIRVALDDLEEEANCRTGGEGEEAAIAMHLFRRMPMYISLFTIALEKLEAVQIEKEEGY